MTVSNTSGAPCWIDLITPDPDAAAAFYEAVFGWTAQQSSDEEYGGYITFERDGSPVAGCMKNDGTMGPTAWSVYLETADVNTTAEKALALGGQILVGPMQVGDLGHMLFVMDTAGAAVGAWQPLQHQGFSVRGEVGAPAWFETHTKSFAASVSFYENVFDWDTHAMSDTDELRYTTQGEGDTALAGIMDAAGHLPEDVPSHWMFYVQVANVDDSLARVTELGGQIVNGPDDSPFGRLATIADPQGALLKVMQAAGSPGQE